MNRLHRIGLSHRAMAKCWWPSTFRSVQSVANKKKLTCALIIHMSFVTLHQINEFCYG